MSSLPLPDPLELRLNTMGNLLKFTTDFYDIEDLVSGLLLWAK